MIWDLVMRLGGQMRIASTLAGSRIVGWDMTAALALADARGISRWLVAEFLPEIEAVLVQRMNERGDGG